MCDPKFDSGKGFTQDIIKTTDKTEKQIIHEIVVLYQY